MATSKLIDIEPVQKYEESHLPPYHKQKTQWCFPVPLFGYGLPSCEKINKKIENRVYEKSKEEKTRKASNEGGWHSEGSMHDDPVMEPIVKYIEWAVRDLSIESKMEYNDYQLFLWSNLNRPGDYNTVHDHPDCHMSGVYYVKLPEGDCGLLRMYNPMYSYNYNSSGYNPPYKQPRIEVKGKEGALLIFRAPILHDVTRNNTKEDRISLSFNIRFER